MTASSKRRMKRWYVLSSKKALHGPFFSNREATSCAKRHGGHVIERDAPIPTITIAELARRNGVHR